MRRRHCRRPPRALPVFVRIAAETMPLQGAFDSAATGRTGSAQSSHLSRDTALPAAICVEAQGCQGRDAPAATNQPQRSLALQHARSWDPTRNVHFLHRREPVYPPLQVSFEVGPSLEVLHPAGPRFDVAAADWPQTFHIPPNAPVRYGNPRQDSPPQQDGRLAGSRVIGLGAAGVPCASEFLVPLFVCLSAGGWLPAGADAWAAAATDGGPPVLPGHQVRMRNRISRVLLAGGPELRQGPEPSVDARGPLLTANRTQLLISINLSILFNTTPTAAHFQARHGARDAASADCGGGAGAAAALSARAASRFLPPAGIGGAAGGVARAAEVHTHAPPCQNLHADVLHRTACSASQREARIGCRGWGRRSADLREVRTSLTLTAHGNTLPTPLVMHQNRDAAGGGDACHLGA